MNKRESILEATLELIKDHGFHGCPMSMVAKNSNVAAGTIYHHFKNKDDLIMELYHYVVGKLVNVATEADDASLDFKTRFMQFWHTMKRFYFKEAAIQRFLEQFYNSPYFTDQMQVKDNPWYSWMQKFFESGLESGALRTGARPQILTTKSTNTGSLEERVFKRLWPAETWAPNLTCEIPTVPEKGAVITE